MKTIVAKVGIVVLAILLTCAPASAAAGPTVTFTLLTPLPTDLAVGESYTIQVQVTSDEPFILAMAMPDSYYPGRGIFFHGSDRVTHATEAMLHLTVTGKASTADLAAVSDWPTPGESWPAGVAPASVVVGVRFGHGQVVAQRFNFAVEVP
jgi:hypothetical protein